jgi:hypothetical protein
VGRVVFRLGTKRASVGLTDAKEIQSRAVENSLPARAIHSELGRVIREKSGEIVLDEESRTREQLLLCLGATEAEGRMTDDLRALQKIAQEPITPRP